MFWSLLLNSALAQDPAADAPPVVTVEPTAVPPAAPPPAPESPIAAQDPVPPAPVPPPALPASGKAPYDKYVSITFSPIHLIYPIIELNGEFRIIDRASVAVILGGGNVDGYTAFEFGAQGIGYPLGSFDHGLQLGGEILATRLGDDEVNATGVSVGPFIGYKIAARFGLTFNAQLGAAYYIATASSGNVSVNDEDFGALFNLNLGWSF